MGCKTSRVESLAANAIPGAVPVTEAFVPGGTAVEGKAQMDNSAHPDLLPGERTLAVDEEPGQAVVKAKGMQRMKAAFSPPKFKIRVKSSKVGVHAEEPTTARELKSPVLDCDSTLTTATPPAPAPATEAAAAAAASVGVPVPPASLVDNAGNADNACTDNTDNADNAAKACAEESERNDRDRADPCSQVLHTGPFVKPVQPVIEPLIEAVEPVEAIVQPVELVAETAVEAVVETVEAIEPPVVEVVEAVESVAEAVESAVETAVEIVGDLTAVGDASPQIADCEDEGWEEPMDSSATDSVVAAAVVASALSMVAMKLDPSSPLSHPHSPRVSGGVLNVQGHSHNDLDNDGQEEKQAAVAA